MEVSCGLMMLLTDNRDEILRAVKWCTKKTDKKCRHKNGIEEYCLCDKQNKRQKMMGESHEQN